MRKQVFDSTGRKFLRVVNAEPACGEDFCDNCGDCLACNKGDSCPGSRDGEHRWVSYEENLIDRWERALEEEFRLLGQPGK